MAKTLTASKTARAQEFAQKNLGRQLSQAELNAVAANYNGSNLQKSVNLVGALSPLVPNTPTSPVTPAVPDVDAYTAAAEKTAAANLANAQAAVAANRVNQVTPFGNVQYTQSGTDAQGNPIWTATQTLSPELQKAYGGIAGQVSGAYDQAFNPTNLPSYGINPGETYSDAIMRRLEPQQARQSKQLEAQLANQGIMPGSEAYNNAKQQMAQQQNDQLTSAVTGGMNVGLNANQQQFQQEATKYQMPMATLNQFRTGSQPSFVNPANQATVAGPDYLGAYTTAQNAELAKQNMQNAQSSNLQSGLFNLAGSVISNPSVISSAFNTVKSLF